MGCVCFRFDWCRKTGNLEEASRSPELWCAQRDVRSSGEPLYYSTMPTMHNHRYEAKGQVMPEAPTCDHRFTSTHIQTHRHTHSHIRKSIHAHMHTCKLGARLSFLLPCRQKVTWEAWLSLASCRCAESRPESVTGQP